MFPLFLLMSLGCGSPGPEAPSTDATTKAAPAGSSRDIDVTQLAADLEEGKVALLVDVRSAGEFATGHVPGAVNIPLDVITSRTEELKAAQGKDLYLICQSGGRSGRAASQLKALGWDAVNVSGGTGAWIANGHPTE